MNVLEVLFSVFVEAADAEVIDALIFDVAASNWCQGKVHGSSLDPSSNEKCSLIPGVPELRGPELLQGGRRLARSYG